MVFSLQSAHFATARFVELPDIIEEWRGTAQTIAVENLRGARRA